MEIEARNAQLIENLDEDPLGLETDTIAESMDEDALCIQLSDDNKSDNEYSDGKMKKFPIQQT